MQRSTKSRHPSWMSRTLLAAVFGLLFAGCQEPGGGTSVVSDSEGDEVGEDAPDDGDAAEAESEAPPTAQVEMLVASGEEIEHQPVDFREAINTQGKTVIVDFWATWCGPCRMLAPELEKIAKEHPDDYLIVKVDVDDAEDIAAHYDINGIPDMRFFRDGKAIGGAIGFQPAEKVLSAIPQ